MTQGLVAPRFKCNATKCCIFGRLVLQSLRRLRVQGNFSTRIGYTEVQAKDLRFLEGNG